MTRDRPGWPGPLSLAGAFSLISAAAWMALTSPRVPYNVRELSEGRSPLWTAPLLALLLLAVFGIPAWLAAAPLRRPDFPAWRASLLLLAQGTLVWLLLRVAVPVEALHDIVGSPVLRGSREAETAGRFLALFLGAATMLLGAAAAWIAWEERDRRPLARWAAGAIVILPASYAVVVPLAATDNLTELLRGGGGALPAAAIGMAVATLGIAGSGISRLLAGRSTKPLAAIAISCLMVPAGFVCLQLGLEPAVEKYGRTFSALQFLLSEDRAHLAGEGVVRLRYSLAFVSGVVMIALAQHAAWLGSRPSPQGASARSPARAQPESGRSSTTASAEKE